MGCCGGPSSSEESRGALELKLCRVLATWTAGIAQMDRGWGGVGDRRGGGGGRISRF